MIIREGNTASIQKRLQIMSQITISIITRCQYVSHFHNGISYDDCLLSTLPEITHFENFIKEFILPGDMLS